MPKAASKRIRQVRRLRAAAVAARRLHYAPYSGHQKDRGHLVLAAAELVSGTVGGGSNVEIVNLSLTKHAEEVAILAAFANDSERVEPGRLSAVYVAGASPCGSCRQFAAEFASEDAVWIVESVGQEELRTTPLTDFLGDREPEVVSFREYLPAPFSASDVDSR